MRSRFCFFTSGYSGALVNARGNIDRISSDSPAELEIKDTIKRGEMWMSLITCGSIHGVMNGLVITLEEDERFLRVWLYYSEQFCRFANGSAKIAIKSYFMRSFFLAQCIQQQ